MWTGGTTGGTHVADDLSLADTGAGTNAFAETAQVEIGGGVDTVVADADCVAAGAFIFCREHSSVSD